MSGSSMPYQPLTLVTGGQSLTGWESVRVTRGAERMPSDFEISLTERYPTQPNDIVVTPGDSCEVYLGADIVLSGYIDRYSASISPGGHTIQISGRSKCEDLVDCSAALKGMQVSGTSTLDLAQKLAKPYGITVASLSGTGPKIPQFNVTLGETPYEIIERVARYSAMLVYDDTDGNLILAQAGASQMASGFDIGVNIQQAAVEFTMDGRYYEYLPAIMSVDALSDLGSGNTPYPPAYDKAVRSTRLLIIVSEQGQNGVSIAEQRAQWEASRRYGRSQSVRLTCDSWRDSQGALWAPNALAPINIPVLKLVSKVWLISEVTFNRNAESGTTADLVLMPKEAFQPEPNILQLYDWQVAQALNKGGASGTFAGGPTG